MTHYHRFLVPLSVALAFPLFSACGERFTRHQPQINPKLIQNTPPGKRLLGNATFNGSNLPTGAVDFNSRSLFHGRIAVMSKAFEECVDTYMRNGHSGYSRYIGCTGDAWSDQTMDVQVAKAIAIARNTFDITMNYEPNGEGNAHHHGHGSTYGSSGEDFDWCGWFGANIPSSLPICKDSTFCSVHPTNSSCGTYVRADNKNGNKFCQWDGYPWPYSQAAGIIFHEEMHHHQYGHGDNSDNAKAITGCGIASSVTNWHFQMSTVPYIIGDCVSQVIANSDTVCGGVASTHPLALNIENHFNGSGGCTMMYDPRVLVPYKHVALGSVGGFLGQPTTNLTSTPNGLGFYIHYQGGSVYWSPKTDAHEVHGLIRDKWQSLGWENSFLGFPTTDETSTPDGIGRYNHFEGGSIYWTSDLGAHEVHGAIRSKWSNFGWEKSFLGYPTTDETSTPDGKGRYNHFQNGSIYWTAATGAFEVHGLIRNKWADLGWETGYLGYPLTDETSTPDGVGRYNHFEGGSIYWMPALGASAVNKIIRDKWGELDGVSGQLGYPISDTTVHNDGMMGPIPVITFTNEFQGGWLSWNVREGFEVSYKPRPMPLPIPRPTVIPGPIPTRVPGPIPTRIPVPLPR